MKWLTLLCSCHWATLISSVQIFTCPLTFYSWHVLLDSQGFWQVRQDKYGKTSTSLSYIICLFSKPSAAQSDMGYEAYCTMRWVEGSAREMYNPFLIITMLWMSIIQVKDGTGQLWNILVREGLVRGASRPCPVIPVMKTNTASSCGSWR